MICPPMIHTGGSSREALIHQKRGLMRALREAQSALDDAAPNQRDYYPKPETWAPARAEHEARALALQHMLRDVEAEAVAILDAQPPAGREER